MKKDLFWASLFISPLILLKEDVIFNSYWAKYPIDEKYSNPDINKIIKEPYDDSEFTFERRYYFSVYLKKNDTTNIRIKKLKQIEKYLTFLKQYKPFFSNSHEFLFANRINLKSYLIGICYDHDGNKNAKNILEKKYPTVKIYEKLKLIESNTYPKLMDMCPE